MATHDSEGRLVYGSENTPRSSATLAVFVAVAVAPLPVIAMFVISPLALPVFSIFSIVMSVIVGLLAFRSGIDFRAKGITAWDLAAAFMLTGCAAGMLGDPQQVLDLYGTVTAIR